MKTKPPSLASHIINAVLKHVRTNKDSLIAPSLPAPQESLMEPNIPATICEQTNDHAKGSSSDPIEPQIDTSILLVGIDWGATKTTIKAAYAGSFELAIDESIPTVLGYVKDGLIDAALPENATTFFGREALTHRRYLHLTNPTLNSDAAIEFSRHLRARLQIDPDTEIRAVIAVPPGFDGTLRENLRQSFAEHFQSLILLPSPYLAALGYNSQEAQCAANSFILIDLGATSITACLIQGCYPEAEEQTTIDFGGNDIDRLLRTAILEKYPDAELSPITIRLLKEKHACAGYPEKPIHADIVLSGQPKTVDLTDEITAACNELLYRTAEAIKTLLTDNSIDDDDSALPPIILTGGVSRIKNFPRELETILVSEGYDNSRVTIASSNANFSGSNPNFIALGALKAARHAREDHWQQVTQ